MKRFLTLLFCLALFPAMAGVPYVVNYGDSTNAHIKGTTTIDNLLTGGVIVNQPSTLVAVLKYVEILDAETDSGLKETGVNTWTNILFQASTISSGSYDTATGKYTVADDGYVKFWASILLGNDAVSITNGTIVLVGINGTEISSSKATRTAAALPFPFSGFVPVFKGDKIAFSVLSAAPLAINTSVAYIEFLPASSPSNSLSFFSRLATNVASSCEFTYSGGTFSGTNSWQPAGDGTYPLFVVRDAAIAVRYAPQLFTAVNIKNLCNQTASLQGVNDAGVGVGIAYAGTPSVTAPSDVDHSFEFVDLVYSHFLKAGSATAFTQHSVQISNTLAFPVITNHLVYIRTNNPVRVGFGFQDAVKVCGYDLVCSLQYYRTCRQMAAMLTSLGRTSDAAYYTSELSLISTNLKTFLWDSSTNLFFTGTVLNTTQHSIPGSALCVVLGASDSGTLTAIATRLKAKLPGNSDDLAGQGMIKGGQVRHMTEGQFFNVFFSPVAPGEYQNGGYWPLFTLWVAKAIRTIDAPSGDALINSLARRYQNEPIAVVPREFENNPSGGGSGQYLDSALAPLGYYKTTDTNR